MVLNTKITFIIISAATPLILEALKFEKSDFEKKIPASKSDKLSLLKTEIKTGRKTYPFCEPSVVWIKFE